MENKPIDLKEEGYEIEEIKRNVWKVEKPEAQDGVYYYIVWTEGIEYHCTCQGFQAHEHCKHANYLNANSYAVQDFTPGQATEIGTKRIAEFLDDFASEMNNIKYIDFQKMKEVHAKRIAKEIGI